MNRQKWILLAEDNLNDADLAARALAADGNAELVVVAHDGVQAMDCLHHRGEFHSHAGSGNPALVLLDLKMPRMSGMEVLRQIRSDAGLKPIPVVVFTTSREPEDVAQCYRLGANAYVVKPVGFDELVTVLKATKAFWLGLNQLPPKAAPQGTRTTPFRRSRRSLGRTLSLIS
jgi:CheY-like chemotaxis protein